MIRQWFLLAVTLVAAMVLLLACAEDKVVAPPTIDLAGHYDGVYSTNGWVFGVNDYLAMRISMTIEDSSYLWQAGSGRDLLIYGAGFLEIKGDSLSFRDTLNQDIRIQPVIINGDYRFHFDDKILVFYRTANSQVSQQAVMELWEEEQASGDF